MTIHTIGDSHSYNGFINIKDIQIKIHHLGAKLCHSIGRDGISIETITEIKENDTVLFSFGEIDCRCHIYKHITETNTYKVIINNIIDNYFQKIQLATNAYDNIKVCIYNIVPPVEKNNTPENPDYPYLGSDHERQTFVLYFNKVLKKKCIDYDYIFFDIYNYYTNSNGFLNNKLSDGNVHIADGTYIKQFILDNNL